MSNTAFKYITFKFLLKSIFIYNGHLLQYAYLSYKKTENTTEILYFSCTILIISDSRAEFRETEKIKFQLVFITKVFSSYKKLLQNPNL